MRSLGAKVCNIDGDAFIHPLETRDVEAAGIIREVKKGKGIPTGMGEGVWLDTPMIELKNGEGTIEKRIPAMLRMFEKYDIDIRRDPILVYPTLHYQNGGVEIDRECKTNIGNLFVAGEASGGIHGTNRLMGNSLLDVVVFGRIAGTAGARQAQKNAMPEKLSLKHVKDFEKERAAAGIKTQTRSPRLLPHYTHRDGEL